MSSGSTTRLFFVLALVFAAGAGPSGFADAMRPPAGEEQSGPANTWSATSRSGLALGGTWTANADAKTGHVTGRWTLIDPSGRTVARGGWSAVKSPSGWRGMWRANVDGSQLEYSGNWSTVVDLGSKAALGSLFEKAVATVVGGRWRSGGHSGAWSIRAFR
jgi:hypothetical protein